MVVVVLVVKKHALPFVTLTRQDYTVPLEKTVIFEDPQEHGFIE